MSQANPLFPGMTHVRESLTARLCLGALAIFLVLASFASIQGQQPAADRLAEWHGYALPTAEFSRLVDADNGVVLRVPASWKKEPAKTEGAETAYRFAGPHAS